MSTESRKSTSWITAEMKTYLLVLMVVAVHGALVGSLIFVGGCGRKTTTPDTPMVTPEETVPMPMPKSVAENPKPSTMPSTAKGAAVIAPTDMTSRPAPFVKGAKTIEPSDTHEYVVQSGDQIASIAKRSNTTAAEIIAMNNISNPGKIFVGQKLLIPGKGTKAKAKSAVKLDAKSGTTAAKPAGAAPSADEYVVQSGDSLGKIAKNHGVKIAALKETNNLKSDVIRIGQKLKIPSAKKEASVEKTQPVQVDEPAPIDAVPMSAPEVTVPEAPAPVPAPTVSPAGTTQIAPDLVASAIVHTVRVNDDIGTIAKLYNVKAEAIAKLNNLSPDTVLIPDQKLKIPEITN